MARFAFGWTVRPPSRRRIRPLSRSIRIVLDRDRFAAKTTAKGWWIPWIPWILSSGTRLFNELHGFFLERIFLSLDLRRRQRPVGGRRFRHAEERGCSREKLTLISDFLQSIVVDRARSQSPTTPILAAAQQTRPKSQAEGRRSDLARRARPSRWRGPPLSGG
jgi:hypothetical protein